MIILASASPRRAQILSQLGFIFRVELPSCDESIRNVSKEGIPKELAKRKALDVSVRFPDDFTLGGDTLVFCDSLVLGKPKDTKEAFEMLKNLKNRSHKVVSGLALCKNGQVLFSGDECTEVCFRDYTDSEILNYISTMEYIDKAGAYGAQGKGARFIKSINGCFYNVMGLPVALAMEALNDLDWLNRKE
jgi:septum formation protein